MDPLKILFLLSGVLSLCHGLRLSGRCPEVPASNVTLGLRTYFGAKIFSIPFEEKNPSNIFRDRLVGKGPEELRILSNGSIEINNVRSHLSGNIDRGENGSWALNTSIAKVEGVSDCPDQFVEVISMWLDGDFCLVWSCRDEEDLRHHDEALVVFNYDSASSETEVKILVGKYVPSLVDYIDPWLPIEFGFQEKYGVVYCPSTFEKGKSEYSAIKSEYYIVCFVAALVVVFFVILYVHCYH